MCVLLLKIKYFSKKKKKKPQGKRIAKLHLIPYAMLWGHQWARSAHFYLAHGYNELDIIGY